MNSYANKSNILLSFHQVANTPIHLNRNGDFSFVMDDDIGIDSEVLMTGDISEPFGIVILKPGGEECSNCSRVNIPSKSSDSGSQIRLTIPSVAEVRSGTPPIRYLYNGSFGHIVKGSVSLRTHVGVGNLALQLCRAGQIIHKVQLYSNGNSFSQHPESFQFSSQVRDPLLKNVPNLTMSSAGILFMDPSASSSRWRRS